MNPTRTDSPEAGFIAARSLRMNVYHWPRPRCRECFTCMKRNLRCLLSGHDFVQIENVSYNLATGYDYLKDDRQRRGQKAMYVLWNMQAPGRRRRSPAPAGFKTGFSGSGHTLTSLVFQIGLAPGWQSWLQVSSGLGSLFTRLPQPHSVSL